MSTNELVDTIKNGDNVKANKAFNNVMGSKIKAALDAKKIDIATSMGRNNASEVSIDVPEKE